MKNTATVLLMAIRVLVFGAWVFRFRSGYFAALWVIGSFAAEFVLFVYQYERQRRAREEMVALAAQQSKPKRAASGE